MKIIRAFEPRCNFLKLVPKGGVVLDCGSGDFLSTNKLREIRPDIEWHCLDLATANAVPDGLTFKTCNFESEKIPYPDSYFDAVYALHVVEHINNLPLFSKELFRILKSNGHLFVEVPSVKSIFLPSSNFYDDITHIKPFTVRSLKYFVQCLCSLEIVQAKTARNFIKIILTPLLITYSLLKRNNYYTIGLADIVGARLFSVGKKNRI